MRKILGIAALAIGLSYCSKHSPFEKPTDLPRIVVNELLESKIIEWEKGDCGFHVPPELLNICSPPNWRYKQDCFSWDINQTRLTYYCPVSRGSIYMPSSLELNAKGDSRIGSLYAVDLNLDGLDSRQHPLIEGRSEIINRDVFSRNIIEKDCGGCLNPEPVADLNEKEKKEIRSLYEKHLKRILDYVRKRTK